MSAVEGTGPAKRRRLGAPHRKSLSQANFHRSRQTAPSGGDGLQSAGFQGAGKSAGPRGGGGRERPMRQQHGFSLIELLIVVAIILIIAAIAIPNLLQAKIAANESSAVGSIRAIKSAEFAYTSAYPTVGYALSIAELGGAAPCTPTAATACILDNVLAQATPGSAGKSGYTFLATGLTGGGTYNAAFVAGSAPIAPKSTGNRSFCSTDDGVLRVQPLGTPVPVNTTAACLAYPIAQ
jgi:type IV pilus assembly protein PilA